MISRLTITLLALITACSQPPTPSLALPAGLELLALPQAQKDLLRVTLEISEAALPETDVVLDTKDLTLSGSFTLQNVDDGDRVATLRVYGRFDAESEEVLLGRASDNITITLKETNGLDFGDKLFDSCDVGADGNCSILFDANRNLSSNILDLVPLSAGGRAIDPAPQPIFVEAAPQTLQFASGIRLGSFARQVIVIENRGINPMTIDSLDVGGGQGVALSLFDPFGGPVAVPRRSMPADELTAIIEPGDELLVAVSFAPVNSFLTTAGIQIVARDTKTNVVQSSRVKVIANADGTLRPRPADYVEPDIGANFNVGSGSIPVSAFPPEELFSGQEITDAGLSFKGATLTHVDDSGTFSMPADRAFVVEVPAQTRLAVSVTGLESDIDLALAELDADNAIADLVSASRHPLTSAEGLDFLNDTDAPQRMVVVLGRVDVEAVPTVEGGLALDVAAPFQLSCELSRGPEFTDKGPIDPIAGPLEGGTPFTLRGSGFQPGAVVTFADFRALDVVITVDPETGDTLATGRMPPGSLEVGKNPATAVVANPSAEAGGDGQAATLPEAFLYDPPAARIDVVLPDVAPTDGAPGPVTILGSFFTVQEGPIRVNFGDNSVEAVFVNGTTLTATPGPAEAGTVVLTVQNQIRRDVYGAKSNGVAFRFSEPEGPTPTITRLSPVQGAADGGDAISISGSGFVLGTRVLVGSVEASVVNVDPDAISFTSPSVEFDGPVAVTVVNPDGQSATLPAAFTYFFPQPRIEGFLPTRVPTTGGTLIIVTGASIRNGVTAVFKRSGSQDVPPLSAVRTSSTSVLVTTPPLTEGEVLLSLTNPDGQEALSEAIEVFEPQGVGPTIVFVEPASGPLQGQNLITIAGNDFDPDGVRVVLAGTTFQLPVEPGAAAGFDRVQFVAPPSLTTGTEPIVLENGDGQSAVGTYLYVQVDVARIDQVLPRELHILPGTEIQILGEFFSSFSSELQIFLGAGQNQQVLPLVARSDGLIVGRVTQRLSAAGFTGISLTDGVTTTGATIAVVVPTIVSADQRNDEIEVLGAHLAGVRLQTFCAGSQAFRPTIASDDVLVVRRDDRLDARCPADGASPRPITLLYDNGAERFAPLGAFVTDETDADGDGVGVRDDANDNEPCVPNLIAAVCDFDKDGLTNAVDVAGQDPCVPSSNAAPCLKDSDGDGTRDPLDNVDDDACIPNDQALTCAADSDRDGVTNPFDPKDQDPCAPNPASSACSLDTDADGVTDAFDPVDANPCIPNVNASNCDADRDDVRGGSDADNNDPCVPDDQDPLCTDDDDRDGLRNAIDLNPTDPCVPDDDALVCQADNDSDGVINPFDPNDGDTCDPNPASIACTADADRDGITNPFDPVDTNSCIPNVNASNCDADNDSVLGGSDADNNDPCVPDNQDPLCTDDDDRDGVRNAADSAPADPCLPNSEALVCEADADVDGVANPFDSDDVNPCVPSPAAATCTIDGDSDGTTDPFDPVDTNECIPNVNASNCDADNDGEFGGADDDNNDPCVPDNQDPLCTDDDDRDGVRNAADSAPANACVPDAEALVCDADADSDGVANPFDSDDADTCVPNPGSSACTIDNDRDGVTNPFDPVDDNSCIPNVNASNCDADNDGVLGGSDGDNNDPCLPDNQDPLCTDDDDRDGVRNAADSAPADPCLPNSEALVCEDDADNDGVANPFDSDDFDPCVPNPGSPACTIDSDNDGTTNPFDPVDTNACIPNVNAANCDADNDLVLGGSDGDNSDPCVPDNQDPLCTDDDDRDGLRNAADSDPADPCLPNAEALVCEADADNDGVANPFDSDDVDTCVPNPASPACSGDTDNDGTTNPFDPVDDNACIPNVNAANCDADGDLVLGGVDTNNQNPCIPDALDVLCTDDSDRDGVVNGVDANAANPCIPSSEALTCTQDNDGDGVANPFDANDVDPCSPNPAAPTCTADTDNDGTTNPFDPVDTNACVPNLNAANCDADNDGVLGGSDGDNSDPCVPDNQDPLCTDDDDRDGLRNAADSDPADPCLPNAEALVCEADADTDGVANPFDSDDVDTCVPNPASPACSGDNDNDGTTNPFDPVDDNACIPNVNAANCDADGDLVLGGVDTNNQNPCIPDALDVLCTDDSDRDGVVNGVDTNAANPCIPSSEALTCTQDNDGDGVANPFDANDVDPCSPNPASATCTADTDNDGTTNPFDPVDNNACIPNVNVANCDADGDGVAGGADANNNDPCLPDDQDILCTDDDDGDGTLNAIDSDDLDACIPNAEALLCDADADADGVTNPFDASDADPCQPNPASSACTADSDGDGTTNPFDPVDTNPCIPNVNTSNCDADGDLVLGGVDTDNQNPCLPDPVDALCTDDNDRDGVVNGVDGDANNPCVPSSEALTCTEDNDGDGVANPFDAADADGCSPNPASAACTVDDDNDGVTNPFDPIDTNPCVPDVSATNCDADNDGLAAADDVDNQNPCVPNANNALCTDDNDRDGVLNPADADDADPCLPNVNALTCTQDADNDGVANPFDSNDADACVPNSTATNCQQPPTIALLSPTQIHADVFGDTLSVVGTRLDAVTTVQVVQVSNGAITASSIVTASATNLVVRPNVALNDSSDIGSQYLVRVIASAGTATSPVFDARRPRVAAGLDEDTGVVLLGDFFNPTRIVDAVLDAGGGQLVQLTVRSATENFIEASFDSSVVDNLDYQVSVTYLDANNNNVTVSLPSSSGFAFRRVPAVVVPATPCGNGVLDVAPVNPVSLTFTWLATSCAGPSNITFAINGTNVSSTEADPGSCTCTPGIRSVVLTNATALDLIVNGNNSFSVTYPGPNDLFAWATVTVTQASGAQEFQLFDFGGGNHALTHNADLCASSFSGSQPPTTVVASLSATEPCDDGDNSSGDGCSAACTVEAGFACVGAPSNCFPAPLSCLALRNAGQTVSGTFTIDPDAAGAIAPFDVHCDMVTDGGGYTFLKVDQGFTQDDAAEAFCASKGMELIIPRTQAHLQSAVQIARNAAIGPGAGDDFMQMLGVYPLFNGANCVGQPMNSANAGCQWDARDGGSYFVHNSNAFGEPNGDNCITCSMNYAYDGAGNVAGLNDQNHVGSARFMCDIGDKQ